MAEHESETIETIKLGRGMFLLTVRDLGGRVIDTSGDQVLATFDSPSAAVLCARLVQRNLAERNATTSPDRVVRYRVGIERGDVRVDGERIYGTTVNVAARLQARAPAGGLCISHAVYEQVRDRLDVELDDLGELELKNIPHPVRAWALEIDASS